LQQRSGPTVSTTMSFGLRQTGLMMGAVMLPSYLQVPGAALVGSARSAQHSTPGNAESRFVFLPKTSALVLSIAQPA